MGKFINFKFHVPGKSFTDFIANLIKDYGINPEFFPKDSARDIAGLLRALNIEHPRPVRRMVTYLIEWQKRLYVDSDNDTPNKKKQAGFFERISKENISEAKREEALRLLNSYLVLMAVIKEEYSTQYNIIIQKSIFPSLPFINTEAQDESILVELFKKGNLEDGLKDNSKFFNPDWRQALERINADLVDFSSVLWRGLSEINRHKDLGSKDVGNDSNQPNKTYYRGRVPFLLNNLLEITFRN